MDTKNNTPFFSIVTISYNQKRYLSEAINSVIGQSFQDYEYFVQDPGSSDGSRELIESYSSRLTPLFESDTSPAHGLNLAFAKATGKYYLFINSDDILLPGSLEKIYQWILNDRCRHDVYSGACKVIDGTGVHLRYAFSDKMNLNMAAYGQCILIQPSSVVSSIAFKSVGGFNVRNHSNWDGELFIDIAMSGYKFARSPMVLSSYRVHSESITGSGALLKQHSEHRLLMFKKITGANSVAFNPYLSKYYWLKRRFFNPRDVFERLFHGPIFSIAAQ